MTVSGRRRVAAAVGLAVTAGVVAGCRADANVVEVLRTDDPAVLEVVVDTCNADLEVAVTETDDEVVIDVDNNDRASLFAGGDDCQDLVTIELDRALGDRSVALAGGTPVLLLPFPTPTAVSDETAAGPIAFCGVDDPPSPSPDPRLTEQEIRRYNEQSDLAALAAQEYRSDPNWRGMSGRFDGTGEGDSGELVFVFHFADVDPQLEADIGEVMGDVPFEVAPAEYTDDELDAAKLRIESALEASDPGSVSGVGSSSGGDVPGRIVVYMSNPAEGADLAERVGLAPPYGPYCIWPNPSVGKPSGD